MKIHFSCPFCAKSYSVDETLAGRKGRCKDCGTTMQIPGATATKPVAPAPAPAPKARPAARPRPAPDPAPMPAHDVSDPYGLADEPAPMPARRDMLADAEEAAALPRGGMGKPGGGARKKKKKRGADEGPWGLPIRQGAIGLMVLVLFLGRVMKYARRAHQEGEIGPYLQTGMLGLCLLAAALSLVSVVGAIVSFSRGNRSAFRGESTGGQAAWGLTVLASLAVAYFFLTGTLSFSGRGQLAAMDASLSATERVPIGVYEDLVDTAIRHQRRMAAALDKLGSPEFGAGMEAAMELEMLKFEAESILARGRSTPAPTREQVSQLYAKFADPFRQAFQETVRAARDAQGRLDAPPGSPPAKAMREVVDGATEYADGYARAYPEGSTDSTGWYFAVFSKDAGSGTRDFDAALARAPVPAPAPPTGAPVSAPGRAP
ncbi:hypothetical protein, partial [Paludisphaera sp.]|uniref:hypothetical protein n=1 Tax=Paludisphaera sp. TaxID=2017432 RepID=UPI00301E3708